MMRMTETRNKYIYLVHCLRHWSAFKGSTAFSNSFVMGSHLAFSLQGRFDINILSLQKQFRCGRSNILTHG